MNAGRMAAFKIGILVPWFQDLCESFAWRAAFALVVMILLDLAPALVIGTSVENPRYLVSRFGFPFSISYVLDVFVQCLMALSLDVKIPNEPMIYH